MAKDKQENDTPLIKTARFLKSSTSIAECPAPNLPEYAFIGRSNVGKSSLINMLTGNKNLAKTSSTPGKTQLINHFIINEEWYLVDLPGYGFAKISRTQREQWEKMTMAYLKGRKNLVSILILVDLRIPPQNADLEFMANTATSGLPFAIVFTKFDKLTKNESASNLAAYKKRMLADWESMPDHFVTSAIKGTGKAELLNYIQENNKYFYESIT